MSLSAGRLSERITILSKTVVRDAIGGEGGSTWVPVLTAWAEITPMRMREYIAARAGQVDLTCKITIRYRRGLLASMRVQHGAAIYDIREVVNVGSRDSVIELMCSGPEVAT